MTGSILDGGEYPGHSAEAAVSPPKPWRRRPALFGALGVVVALVALAAGLAVWLMRSSGPIPNREPFEAALAALDTAHAVRYRSSVAGGEVEWDVRVTRRGEAVGTATVEGQQSDVLVVEGRTFIKLPAALLPRLSSGTPVEAWKDKWITGSVVSDGLPGSLKRHLRAPGELSRDLHAALDDAIAVPTADGPGIVVDGVAALAADTSAGRLFVTKDAPHRVLRLVRTGSGARSSLPSPPSLPAVLTVPTLPTQQGPSSSRHGAVVRLAGATQPRALPDPENIDFPAVTREDVDDTYRNLEAGARELTEAVDSDIPFSLNSTAAVHCSAARCTINTHVTASPTGGGGHLSGGIDATLNGSFTIEGRPAGTCTSVARLNSLSGSIGCHSAAAGRMFAEVASKTRAHAQARADAYARARPDVRVFVPYQIAYSGEAYVTAKVSVNVPAVVQQLADDRANASMQAPMYIPGLSPNKWAAHDRKLIQEALCGDLDLDRLTEKVRMKVKYRYFDCWDRRTQTMTDVKTIDHRYDTKTPANITSTGMGFVKKILEFSAGHESKGPGYWSGDKTYGRTPKKLRIGPDDVTNYVLVVGFPADVTDEQRAAFQAIVTAGHKEGIAVFLIPILS